MSAKHESLWDAQLEPILRGMAYKKTITTALEITLCSALAKRPRGRNQRADKPMGSILCSVVDSGPYAFSLHVLQASFVEKLKGDFENLSIAIADLPVGFIPFPDR